MNYEIFLTRGYESCSILVANEIEDETGKYCVHAFRSSFFKDKKLIESLEKLDKCTFNSEVCPDLINKFNSFRALQVELYKIYEDDDNELIENYTSNLQKEYKLKNEINLLEKEIILDLIELENKKTFC